jgi:TetR/AcrR family transcriptional regulator, transcriptional repressor for nem operon
MMVVIFGMITIIVDRVMLKRRWTEGEPMKVTREQAKANRARVLEVAGRLFREKGLDGIGVDALMQGAGLTHGGFYANFTSKEDLMAQACEHALAELVAEWSTVVDGANGDPLTAVVAGYLAASHRDDLGNGCVLAALGTDLARKSPAVRHGVTAGMRRFIALLTRIVPGRSRVARRQRALALYASLVGAMVLARAVDDPALSEEILQAVAQNLRHNHRRDQAPSA